MKESGIFTMSGCDEVGQPISSINKPVPQEILPLEKIKKRRQGQIYKQEIMCGILLPGIFLYRWQRAPLNFIS